MVAEAAVVERLSLNPKEACALAAREFFDAAPAPPRPDHTQGHAAGGDLPATVLRSHRSRGAQNLTAMASPQEETKSSIRQDRCAPHRVSILS